MQTHKIRHSRPKSFHHWLLGMVFLSCIASAGSASAQWSAPTLTIDDGPENIDGEYTVTATLDPSCDFMEIFECHENFIALYERERANGGDWHLLAKHEPSDRPVGPEAVAEVSVTLKRDNGTYDYRVYSVIYWWSRSSTGTVIWDISRSETSVPKTIIVNKPGKPTKPKNLRVTDQEDQYDNSYKVQWGAPTSGDFDYYLVQERKNQDNWCLNPIIV